MLLVARSGVFSPCQNVLWDRADMDFWHLKSEENLSALIGFQAKNLEIVYTPLLSFSF